MAGWAKHGIKDVQITANWMDVRQSDLYVCWAWKPFKRETRWEMLQKAKIKTGARTLVMERAYVGDRYHWVSLGYDGLNGRADFCLDRINNPNRWNTKFSNVLQPPKENSNSNKAVVLGQCRHDASVNHINFQRWVELKIQQLQSMGFDVYYRPHPLDVFWPDVSKYHRSPPDKQSLEELIGDAKLVVSFNSNSSVLSTIAGIPTIAEDEGAMIYKTQKYKSVKEYDRATPFFNETSMQSRIEFASKLAYCQWLPEEIESGEAWEHLKHGMINAQS